MSGLMEALDAYPDENGKIKTECYYCGKIRVMWGMAMGDYVCSRCYNHSIAFNNKKDNYYKDLEEKEKQKAEIEFLKEQLKSCASLLNHACAPLDP